MSPMTILRQSPTDPKWFEDNVNDFSLSSFLGQLDSTCDAEKRRKSPGRDVSIQRCCALIVIRIRTAKFTKFKFQADSSNLSALTDGSVDYMMKFEQLAKEMIHQEQAMNK